MKIVKANLQSALEFPSSIMKRKTTLPVCSCFRLEGHSGRLSVKTSDCDQFAEQKTQCEGDIAPFCVSMNALRCLIPFFKETVEMNLEASVLKIKSGGNFSIHVLLSEDFPMYNQEGLKILALPPLDLAESISKVSFTCEQNTTRVERAGVHILTNATTLIAEATNGIRYARNQKLAICADSDFFVPLDFCENLSQSLRKSGCVVNIAENIIKVQHESGSYACKLAETKFPSTAGFLNTPKTELGAIKPADWLSMFLGAVALNGSDSAIVCKVLIEGNLFNHVGKQGEMTLDLPQPLKESKLFINASTFTACLSAFGESEAKVSVGENGAVFLEAENLTVVTSQLRGQ